MSTPDHELPVFPFRPNWADGITETLEWLTDVLAARRSGAEQRIALRLTPRRSFEAQLDLMDAERTFADLFVQRFHGSEFMLPLWHDAAHLDSPAAIGATTLAFDTTNREFVDGGMALLVGADAFSCEAVRIATVAADGLTLAVPVTDRNWAAGATVHPLRRSRFDPQVKIDKATDRLDRTVVRFDLAQANDYDGGPEELATFAGLPILAPSPDWSGTLDVEALRTLVDVDNGTGLRFVADIAARGFHAQRHRWLLEGRAELAGFRRLLHRLRGRQGALWLPSFSSDLILAAGAAAGATEIDVVECGLDYTDFPAAGRNHAVTASGEALEFSALGISPGAGVERLTLAAPLAGALAAGDALQWMDVGRLDSDRIELFHATDSDGVTRVEGVFRTFADTRDGSADGALDLPTAAMSDDPCNEPEEPDPCLTEIYNGPMVVEVTVPDPLPPVTGGDPNNPSEPAISFALSMSLSVETPSGETLVVRSPSVNLYNSWDDPPPFLGPIDTVVYDAVCDRTATVTINASLVAGLATITVEIDDPHFKFAPNWTEPDQVVDPNWWSHPYDYGDWVLLDVTGNEDDFPIDSFFASATVTIGGIEAASASQHHNWYLAQSFDPRLNGYDFRCVPYSEAAA